MKDGIVEDFNKNNSRRDSLSKYEKGEFTIGHGMC